MNRLPLWGSWHGEAVTERVKPVGIPINDALLPNARTLRKEMTPQERHLWYDFLRSYPVKFYKQRIIGPYIVDFYCASAKLVVEINGSQHYDEQGLAYDAKRTEFLVELGLKVLCFSNAEVNTQFQAVCEAIHNTVCERLKGPSPPPVGAPLLEGEA